MSAYGFLLIDGNNIGNVQQNGGKVLSAGKMQTQAVYGFIRAMRALKQRYPMLTPIVLWDGVSWRYDKFKTYKESRSKEPSTPHEMKQAENRKRWKEQKPYVQKLIQALGIRQMIAFNMEADDLAGMLVKRYQPMGRKVFLISGDKDWLQLVGPGVAWYDPVQDLRVTNADFSKQIGYRRKLKEKDERGNDTFEWRGCPSPAAFLDVKALMGDTSDDIGGVGGIGDKGAYEIVIEYGNVGALMNAYIDKSLDPKKLPKKIRDFVESDEKQDLYHRNRMLMDLRHPEIPEPLSLRITHTPLNPAAVHKLCEELQFASITSNFDNWIAPFAAEILTAPQKVAA